MKILNHIADQLTNKWKKPSVTDKLVSSLRKLDEVMINNNDKRLISELINILI